MAPQVGGLHAMIQKLSATPGPGGLNYLNVLPDFRSNWDLAVAVFIMPIAVQWWSVWYPGAEPGGGSYIAQRMLAAKSERDALTGTLFFNVAHYALRSWPWILVALASILVFPNLSDISRAFPYVDPRLIGNDMAYPAMLTFLPVGWLGLMVAGLLAAYVSTISTHLNWGTSYLVHDFYRRFLKPGADEKHYVLVGRIVTGVLMILAGFTTLALNTAAESFQLLLSVGAGTGLIYLLRWFWWRINAWSEIWAMLSSFLIAVAFFVAKKMGAHIGDQIPLLATVACTTVVWVAATYLSKPTDRETLVKFYRLVRPAGPGWKPVQVEAAVGPSPDSITQSLLGWVMGCCFVYAALFGAGSFLYGRTAQGTMWSVLFVVSGIGLLRLFPKLWSRAPVAPVPDVESAVG
jgi:Na+/proline symporter